jgi:hypothetical protein
MRIALPIVLVAVTVGLMVIGLTSFGRAHVGGTIAVEEESSFTKLAPKASTPEQALANLMAAVQKRNWDEAYAMLSKASGIDEQAFTEDWRGSNGSLRAYSVLEGYVPHPLHISDDNAEIRVRINFASPVGPIEDVRDIHFVREGDAWKALWPKVHIASVPAQVVPETYLKWDLVTGSSADQWGQRNVDSPHVRITSMTAVNTAEGAVVMGELVNEDTIPAFVNVNATLLDAAGNPIDEESSFDKIAHVLLPKQVTPYRVDFPNIDLKRVKSVRMDEHATLVPASADPVIGVMNQKVVSDVQGKAVLEGELMNESGEIVNIPHVIASFYDSNGKVIWVADGYVDRALLPQSSEPFAVEIPKSVASRVNNFHVLVNHYNMEGS